MEKPGSFHIYDDIDFIEFYGHWLKSIVKFVIQLKSIESSTSKSLPESESLSSSFRFNITKWSSYCVIKFLQP